MESRGASRRALTAIAVAVVAVFLVAPGAGAVFDDAATVGSNAFGTATLLPPAGLGLSGTCGSGVAGSVPVFVSATSTTGFGAAVTVARPAGVQAGDLLLAQIAADDTNSVTAPGWTLIRQDKDTGEGFWQAVLYRIAGSSEPASYTLTPVQSTAGETGFGISVYRGVDPTNPINAHGGQVTSAFISTITAPSVTTTVANTRLVTFFGRDGAQSHTPPSGMVERWEVSMSSPQDMAASSDDESRSTAGATGSRVATTSGSNNGIGQAVALSPIAASGGGSVVASWSASPSGFASGYRVQRWRGGVLESDQVVAGVATTTAADGPLVAGVAYEYRLFAGFQNWTSSVVTRPVTLVCPGEDGLGFWSRASESDTIAAQWVDPSFTVKELLAPTGRWRIMQTAASRTRDEVIAMGVNAARQVSAQVRAPGGAWSSVTPSPLATVSESFWWGFDVAYESVSGDAMLVWNNGTTGTTGLSYRVWNGTAWSAPATITTPLAGEPQQLQLAADPTSDEMVLVVSNDASEDYALVWNGAQWVPGDALVLDGTGAGNDRTDVNVAYETQSGRAMVVYGSGGSEVRYRTWDGSWSSEATLAAPAGSTGISRWTTLAGDPASNRLALGTITFSGEIWLANWSGSAWQDATTVSTTASSVIAPVVAVGYEGLSGRALATYAESGANAFRYRTWSPGPAWTGELVGPDLGAPPNSMVLAPRPGHDQAMLAVQDAAGQVADVLWGGAASWTTVVNFDTTGETKNQPFSWVWR